MAGSAVLTQSPSPEEGNSRLEGLLRGLVRANQSLLTEADLAQAIAQGLQHLGPAAQADRAYVYAYEPPGAIAPDNCSEAWLRLGGGEAVGPNLRLQGTWPQDIQAAQGDDWDRLAQVWIGHHLSALQGGQNIQGTWENGPTQGVILLVPVQVEGQFWGVLGVSRGDQGQGVCSWNEAEVTLFQGAAVSLGGAIARQRVTESLRASERRLKKVADNFPGMLYQCCLTPAGDLVFTYVSDASQEILGLTLEGMAQCLAYVHPEDIAGLIQAITVSGQTLEPFVHEWRMCTPTDPTYKWVQGNAKPEAQPDGNILWDGVLLDITQRKEFDAQLQDSFNLLNSVINGTPDLIFIKDAEGKYLLSNQALLRTLAPHLSSLEGETDYALYSPAIAAHIQATDRQVMAKGTPQTFEQTVPVGDELRTFVVTKTPYYNQAGEVQGIIGISRDITELQKARFEREQQEQFLRSIYDGVEDAIFVLDVRPDGHAIYSQFNRAAEQLVGKSTAEIANKDPAELFGPEGGAEIQARCQYCISQGRPMTVEENLIFQGKPMWRLSTFNPLRDETGRVYRIVGTSIDITPLKEAQQALQEQATLSQLRAEIDSILTRGKFLQGMLQQCTEVVVTYLQVSFARIWLLNSEEEVLELQASAGLYTHVDGPHSRVPVGQFKIGQIAQERRPHLTNDVPNDPRVGDREWAQREGLVAFAGYPLIVDNQLLGVMALFAQRPLNPTVLEVLGLLADEVALGIKRKQTEEQLQASEARLRIRARELRQALQDLHKAQAHLVQSEKMSSLGQLVAGVAHEINNPVNFIYGNLGYARQYIQDLLKVIETYQSHYPQPVPEVEAAIAAVDLPFLMDDLPKLLNSMKVGAERIQDIVTSLRVFSRKDESERKAVDIHQGLDSTVMILQSRMKAHGELREVELVRDYGDLPLVDCYGGPLNQVFMNILSNAIDALEEHRYLGERTSPRITIQTRCPGDGTVTIRIQDNGPGIPSMVRDRLFDPFFTTKPVGKGTGMGLSISYQIITEKHGGTLTCESEMGVGSTFTITIPLSQTEA